MYRYGIFMYLVVCLCRGQNCHAICSLKSCPPLGCKDSNGKIWKHGQTFTADDGCNQCTCFCNERECNAACSLKSCPPLGCKDSNGKIWKHGQTFTADDGCNSCTCNCDEQECHAKCTRMMCLPGCKDSNGTIAVQL